MEVERVLRFDGWKEKWEGVQVKNVSGEKGFNYGVLELGMNEEERY